MTRLPSPKQIPNQPFADVKDSCDFFDIKKMEALFDGAISLLVSLIDALIDLFEQYPAPAFAGVICLCLVVIVIFKARRAEG